MPSTDNKPFRPLLSTVSHFICDGIWALVLMVGHAIKMKIKMYLSGPTL